MRKFWVILFVFLAARCGDDGSGAGGGDSDGDTDGDTDSDTDLDTDSDTDSDVDTDTGTEECIDGAWTKHLVQGEVEGANCVLAADLDGDGDLDVVGSEPRPTVGLGDLLWFENLKGEATDWTEHTVDGSFDLGVSVQAADMDGDGDLDLMGGYHGAHHFYVSWWENLDGEGGSWSDHTVDYWMFEIANAIFPADIDGDKDLDIITLSWYVGDVTWYENVDGSGTDWSPHTVEGSYNSAFSGAAADLDGDNDLDIIGSQHNSDSVAWWENTDGNGAVWTKHVVQGTSTAEVHTVVAADLDGDGDSDLAAAAYSGWKKVEGYILWWENVDGLGTKWTEHRVDQNFSGATDIVSFDIDGDGDLDLLGAGELAHSIAWWENVDGAGTQWLERTVDNSFENAYAVHAADVDGDGRTDVLGAARVADEIVWWENPCS